MLSNIYQLAVATILKAEKILNSSPAAVTLDRYMSYLSIEIQAKLPYLTQISDDL
jgi:uncharacterized protein (DUF1499 family)